jgi:hypothetical protein
MPTALFSFDDREAAQRAMKRLADAGLSAETMRLHVREETPHEAIASEFDEVATGGFVHNLAHLLDTVFEGDSRTAAESDFRGTLDRGGAVLSVHAQAGGDTQKVDTVMDEAGGVARRSGWDSAWPGV